LDGSGCVAVVDTCANTGTADMLNCSSSAEGICFVKDTDCVSAASFQIAAADTCGSIKGANLVSGYCKIISSGGNTCSVNALQTACIGKKETCAEYVTLTECFSAITELKCVIDAAGTACAAFNDETDACTAIKIHGLTTYTNYHCK
jgi:hypothetical protein